MKHPTPEQLEGFLTDSVEDHVEVEIANHLDSCPGCCQAIEELIGERSSCLLPFHDRSLELTTSANKPDNHSGAIASSQSDSYPQSNFELRFIFQEEIARGGMGIVYRGFDREFKREVAIKVAFKNETALSIRFAREAEISGQLQHPGVVPVYQMGRLSDGRYCMAMRLVFGETLLTLLCNKNENQTLAANLEIFGQICQTMAYAHSKKFVHRDLKPENVMVGSFGEVQVMDWGLAKKINDAADALPDSQSPLKDSVPGSFGETVFSRSPNETVLGQVMGTPAYMAPEQAKGERSTKRTDVFALGGILFHILTGKAPFDESTNTRAIAKSAKANLSEAFSSLELSGADQALIEIVKTCLNPDPFQRPQDAEVVNRRFSQYIVDREQERQDSKLAEARVKERLIAQQKRNRQLAWSAGAILATLAISAAIGLMYLREKNTRIADQAKVEREQITSTLRDEQKIREILSAAAEHERLAMDLQPVHQSEQLILAKKEIEKTAAILSDRIDPELLKACDLAGKRILSETEQSLLVKTNHEAELACLERTRLCCEESLYSNDLKQAIVREQSIVADLAEIYGSLDISPESNFELSVERIANSNLKTELLLGLMIWQRELLNRPNDSPVDAVSTKWLTLLIAASDSDSFRTRVRAVSHNNTDDDSEIEADANKSLDDFEALIETPEAIASRLNIYTVVNQFSRMSTGNNEQLKYLRLAKEQFPEDFLVNWFYAISIPPNDARRNESALTCSTLRPGNYAALWMLGETSVAQADYIQAADVLEKLVVGVPRFASGHVQLAIALEKTGNAPAALEHFGTALELEPDLPSVFRHRGELYSNMKQFKFAISDLLKFQELRPQDPAVDELIFNSYNLSGQTKKAIEALNDIIKKNPKVANNYERLWGVYEAYSRQQIDKGRFAAAKQILVDAGKNYIELTKLVPEFYAPYETLAKHYEFRLEFHSAIKSLQKAILRLPANDSKIAELTKRMASIARRVYELSYPESERDEVIAMLNGVVDFIEPRNPAFEELPELYIALGRIYQKSGQLELAIKATERAYAAQQRTPFDAHRIEVLRLTKDPKVNKMLESFGLPSAVITKRVPVRTDKQLLKIHNPKAISSLAMLWMQQNSPEKSEKIIREALVHTPDSPLLKLVLAKSLAMQTGENPDEKKRTEILQILRQLEFPDNPFQLSR